MNEKGRELWNALEQEQKARENWERKVDALRTDAHYATKEEVVIECIIRRYDDLITLVRAYDAIMPIVNQKDVRALEKERDSWEGLRDTVRLIEQERKEILAQFYTASNVRAGYMTLLRTLREAGVPDSDPFVATAIQQCNNAAMLVKTLGIKMRGLNNEHKTM